MPNGRRVVVGEQSGHRTVVSIEAAGNDRKPVYVVRCRCGNVSRVHSDKFRKATACLECRDRRNGEANGRAKFVALREANPVLYTRWRGMKSRCASPQSPSRKVWAGRGIKVCDEWKDDFPAFVAWALTSGFRDRLTLDRIKEDQDYTPANCQWLTRRENSQKARAVYRGPLKANPFSDHVPIEALWGNT